MSYVSVPGSGGVIPPGTYIQSIIPDTGIPVVPNGANQVNIIGGPGVDTEGTLNTLTINLLNTQIITFVNFAASPYTVLADDQYLSVDATGGAITIRLPNAPTVGRMFTIKDAAGQAVANNITITTVGGVVNIDGATTFVMNSAYEAVSVIFSGSAYEIF